MAAAISNDISFSNLNLLESILDRHFEELSRIEDKINSLEAKIDRLEDKLWDNFYWGLGTLFGLTGFIFLVIAHQFHWLA